MTSCASFSTNSPKFLYDDTLRADAVALSKAAGGPLLAIETSGTEASVCLVHGEMGQVVEHVNAARSLPCEALAQSIADVLQGANLKVSDLAGLVAGVGPGSFTGLRVGLATLQGFAIGAAVPMYGVSSLAVLAASAGPGRVSPVCDARRGDVFAALYEVDARGRARAEVPDNVFSRSNWAAHLAGSAGTDTLLVGDMAQDFATPGGCRAAAAPRRALSGVIQAADAIRAGDATPVQALLPRYLRLSEAERQLVSA